MLYLNEFAGSHRKGNLRAWSGAGVEYYYGDCDNLCCHCEADTATGWKRYDWLDSGVVYCDDCTFCMECYHGLPEWILN